MKCSELNRILKGERETQRLIDLEIKRQKDADNLERFRNKARKKLGELEWGTTEEDLSTLSVLNNDSPLCNFCDLTSERPKCIASDCTYRGYHPMLDSTDIIECSNFKSVTVEA